MKDALNSTQQDAISRCVAIQERHRNNNLMRRKLRVFATQDRTL